MRGPFCHRVPRTPSVVHIIIFSKGLKGLCLLRLVSDKQIIIFRRSLLASLVRLILVEGLSGPTNREKRFLIS